ncbi:MAG: aldehyde dehydrogenase [Burkholderiaceae bacterium]|nr:aldehyde dehydrogenase [Burkholderiaceae bacterium]
MVYELWIDGQWRAPRSGRRFTVTNPATGETIAEVAEGAEADVDDAVRAARGAFAAWSSRSGAERADVLHRVAERLEARLAELVSVEIDQIGRPRREMAAQLARLPEWYRYFAAVARTHEDTVPPFGTQHLNYTRRVPLGVVAQVTPWNHPLLILTKKVAPAMAAGNTIVVKPSELAPITPLMLGEVLREAGVPDGVYNVVPGFGATAGAALCAHPDVAKIDLTGGTETGRRVAAAAGAGLKRVSAELGGKAALIAFPDVDVDRCVAATLFASFIATGQTCVQGARLLVHRSIHDAVVARLVKRANAIRLGDPRQLSTQMGPLVSARQRELVERWVRIGVDEGATLACGGERPEGAGFERGFFLRPTIFTGVTPAMRIAREEIFGPIVCVMPFDTEDEAVAIANGTEFGLASSVWTRELARAHRVAHRLQCGIVWINDHHRIDPASPWGGFRSSGIGRENGLVAYEEYTQIQNVVVNLSEEPFDWYADDATGKRYS